MRNDPRNLRTPTRQTKQDFWLQAGMVVVVILVGFWLVGGWLSRGDPVPGLVRELAEYSEYSIIVDDVQDGFLRNRMSLKSSFQVTEPVGENPDEGEAAQFDERVDTYSISDRLVDRYERSIGMVVAAKNADGTLTGYDQSHPPYYQHVGRSQYGSFGPGGFWIFYGQYAFMSAALGGHRINRGDYDSYAGSRNRGQPYYGPQTGGRPTFGANGTSTATTRPSFSQRFQAKQSRFQARAAGRAASGGRSLGK
jgi:hypothetical protein